MRRLALLLSLALLPAAGPAFEFRSFTPFSAFSGPTYRDPGLPPLSSQTLKDNIGQLAATWNTPDFFDYVSPDFQDLDRLVINLIGSVPTDARMELLELQNFDVLNQQIKPASDGGWTRTSIVTAQVLMQVTYSTAQVGLQRTQSVQVLRLQVKESFE